MMNEQAQIDLKSYIKKTIWSSGTVIALLVAALIGSMIMQKNHLMPHLIGGLLGAFLASINIFALGYAFYALVIAKARRWVILWPLFSFLLMCLIAFVLVSYFPSHSLGFALGLTTPIIFGSVIAVGASKPA